MCRGIKRDNNRVFMLVFVLSDMSREKIFFINHAFETVKETLGFEKEQVLNWLTQLRTNNPNWYNNFMRRCVAPTFELNFRQILDKKKRAAKEW